MSDATSPLALQLAVRVEKDAPPTAVDVCRGAVLATIALIDDERSRPGGSWHDAVDAWTGARIRKIVRRARGAAWERAQRVDGVTIEVAGERGTTEVRAFVPGPMDQAPPDLAKLQIQSSPLEEPTPVDAIPETVDPFAVVIALTPHVVMTWGKRAAQSAHAGQRWWEAATSDERTAWSDAGRPIEVVHPTPSLWDEMVPRAGVRIHDGGYTEVPAGTLTAIAGPRTNTRGARSVASRW